MPRCPACSPKPIPSTASKELSMFGPGMWRFGGRMDPLHEMQRLRGEMNRVFSGLGQPLNPEVPPVNAWVGESDVVVTAELPGADRRCREKRRSQADPAQGAADRGEENSRPNGITGYFTPGGKISPGEFDHPAVSPTRTCLARGPSNSQKKSDCHVPRTSRPFSMKTA